MLELDIDEEKCIGDGCSILEGASVVFGMEGERVRKEIFCDIGATKEMNGGFSTGEETLAAKGSLSSCLEHARKASRRWSENM